MRLVATLFFLTFFSRAMAADVGFEEPEYSFLEKRPIYMFEIASASGAKYKVCVGEFKVASRGTHTTGVGLPNEPSDCVKVKTFGFRREAFGIPGVLEGRTETGLNFTEDEQVTIIDKFTKREKVWTLSANPNVVFRATEVSEGKTKYAHICSLVLQPLDMFQDREKSKEGTIQQMNLFCKALGPIEIEMKNGATGEVLKNPDGTSKKMQTRICPAPKKCMSPEFSIKPNLRLLPDEEETIAHKSATSSGVIHAETPATIVEAPRE